MNAKLLNHLLELRQRAIIVLCIFGAFFLFFFINAGSLFHAFIKPLLVSLPKHSALIATQITSPVLTPLSLATEVALLSTTPFALFHLWRFIKPGLYPSERERFSLILAASFVLFCLGLLFCFYVVLPFMFEFFVRALPDGVLMMPDMQSALEFISQMLLIFGLAFQIPLLCFMLVRWQWVELRLLKKIRPYVIVGAFILGMLLTPPDVMSQILVAIPLCLLYELGIVFSEHFSCN